MNSDHVAYIIRYSQHVSRTSTLYPSTHMLPDTSCSSGIHVAVSHTYLVVEFKSVLEKARDVVGDDAESADDHLSARLSHGTQSDRLERLADRHVAVERQQNRYPDRPHLTDVHQWPHVHLTTQQYNYILKPRLHQWRNYTVGDGGSRLRAPLERGRRVLTAIFFILFNYKILSRFVALIYFVMYEKIISAF